MTESRPEFTIPLPRGRSLELGPVTRVMGILNVTPDSFSDGGRHLEPERAIQAGLVMAADGVDVLDVGGESTRPGATSVGESEEADRVLAVIESLRRELDLPISIDTMKAPVARQALDAGADMINDISALRDPDMLPLLERREVPVVLMHMRGTPRTMQRRTDYSDIVRTVSGFLEDRVASCIAAGISGDRILVDPGLGFGKSMAGNLTLLERLADLGRVGRPLVIGASRKSFVGRVLELPVTERLEGSLAVAAFASAQGAHIVRVHDVGATVRTVRMIDAIRNVSRMAPEGEARAGR